MTRGAHQEHGKCAARDAAWPCGLLVGAVGVERGSPERPVGSSPAAQASLSSSGQPSPVSHRVGGAKNVNPFSGRLFRNSALLRTMSGMDGAWDGGPREPAMGLRWGAYVCEHRRARIASLSARREKVFEIVKVFMILSLENGEKIVKTLLPWSLLSKSFAPCLLLPIWPALLLWNPQPSLPRQTQFQTRAISIKSIRCVMSRKAYAIARTPHCTH